jgi:hypothetical protein
MWYFCMYTHTHEPASPCVCIVMTLVHNRLHIYPIYDCTYAALEFIYMSPNGLIHILF